MRFKYFLIFIFCLLSGAPFAHASLVIPGDYVFNTNLKQGTTLYPDVRYLQNLLNQNFETRVGEIGPGSDESLTDYFGLKTKDAVMRFQNLYREEILTPAGLTTATGFFGERTRAKANAVLNELRKAGTSSQNNTQNNNQNTDSNSNSDNTTSNNDSDSIYAVNSFHNSTNDTYPIIRTVSPLTVTSSASTITVTGLYFTSTGNSVYGTLGSIDNVTSTDNKITFTLNEFSSFRDASVALSGTTTDIYFRIANTNGLSQELGVVRYSFPKINTSNNSGSNNTNTNTTNKPIVSNASTEQTGGAKSSNSFPGVMDPGTIDRQIFGYSPQGTLIKLIGGDSAVDTVYGYTPGGTVSNGGMPGGSSSGGGGAAAGAGGAFGAGAGSGASGGASGGQVTNFGGSITNITYCTCSDGQLLYIRDVRGYNITLFFMYGYSMLKEYYNIYENGVNVLGGFYQSSMECEVFIGEGCETQGTAQGIIDYPRGVGTAAAPTQ